MTGEVLIDTNILIDHCNGIACATEYLCSISGLGRSSVVTVAELLAGYPAHARQAPRVVLAGLPLLEIDLAVAEHAATLRRDHRWKLPDAFQAALAQHYSVRLATRNTKDFPPDRYSFVVVPYDLSEK